jgi:signal peptidase I
MGPVVDFGLREDAQMGGVGMRGLLRQFSRYRGALAVLTLAGCLSACGGLTYRVPAASMEPTLKIGQRVAIDTAAMRAHPPKLDDIIVSYIPRTAELTGTGECGSPSEGAGHPQPCGVTGPGSKSALIYIKRVVGLPGDRIAIVGGHVIRNGSRESDPYIAPCGGVPSCNFPQPVTIPAGEYFVLGDNRGQSDDSRFFGPVPRAWIVGLAHP